MKLFLIITTLILTIKTYSQPNISNVIGTPVEIGNLLIAEFDFPQALTYSEAKEICIDGWRLPTKDEHQNIICPNKKTKIKNLNQLKNYWSGTEGPRYNIGSTVGAGFNVFYKLMYTECNNGTYLNITDSDTNKLMVRLVKEK